MFKCYYEMDLNVRFVLACAGFSSWILPSSRKYSYREKAMQCLISLHDRGHVQCNDIRPLHLVQDKRTTECQFGDDARRRTWEATHFFLLVVLTTETSSPEPSNFPASVSDMLRPARAGRPAEREESGAFGLQRPRPLVCPGQQGFLTSAGFYP